MITVKKIGIAGIGPFKKGVMLPIQPGVSFLYGKNMLNGGNANAVGKSLLGNSINDTFYEPAVRQDKPKAGKRIVLFNRGKDEVKVVHTSGKSEQVSIEVNGKDKTPRTTRQAKKEAQDLWGLSQEEYETYGFVDYATPHPLVKGSTAVRKAFFTSFFGLDQMDAEKKIFAKQLSEIKKTKAAYSELEKAFASARTDMLSKEERLALEARLEKAEASLKKLKELQGKADANARLKAFKELAGNKLKRAMEVTRSVKEVKQDLRRALELEDQVAEYKDYLRDLANYEKATKGVDLSVPLAELEKQSNLYADYRERLHVLRERAASKVKKDFTAVEKPETELAVLEQRYRQLKHELDHSEKFAKGKCETCGQDVEARDPEKVKKALVAIRSEIDQWEAYEEYKEAKANYLANKDKQEKAVAELEELEGKIEKIAKAREEYRKRSMLPPKPKKVEKPEGKIDTDALRKELEITQFFEENENLIEKLNGYQEVEFDIGDLNKVQERVYKIKARLDLHNSVKKRALEIRARLGELQKAMRKQQALEVILEAYADKAMKKMAIESISQHLMESVNRYAALVFENYSFEFVWGTQIQILVHRPEGTSDVRKLSGAESMLFTLILILSLLSFVPKSKRLNLIILDEPYASFSEKTADLFTKLLPHITQIIPSVLIITPKSNFRVRGAHEYTATKVRGGTVLKKGHPDAA